jgi:hypothetical protein
MSPAERIHSIHFELVRVKLGKYSRFAILFSNGFAVNISDLAINLGRYKLIFSGMYGVGIIHTTRLPAINRQFNVILVKFGKRVRSTNVYHPYLAGQQAIIHEHRRQKIFHRRGHRLNRPSF